MSRTVLAQVAGSGRPSSRTTCSRRRRCGRPTRSWRLRSALLRPCRSHWRSSSSASSISTRGARLPGLGGGPPDPDGPRQHRGGSLRERPAPRVARSGEGRGCAPREPPAPTWSARAPAMRQVYQFISRVAPTEATVLILGESGTGKELVGARDPSQQPAAPPRPSSRSTARRSPRRCSRASCSATSAAPSPARSRRRTGASRSPTAAPSSSTRSASCSPAPQVKLLRVLQEREFERVGGTQPLPVDVRVVAATNRDLDAASRRGALPRGPLLPPQRRHRSTMPPLRERADDIPLLAPRSSRHGSARSGAAGVHGISRGGARRAAPLRLARQRPRARERHRARGRPGHRRRASRPRTCRNPSSEGGGTPEGRPASYHDTVNSAKRTVILEATRETKGSYTEAARRLGVHPNYLHRLVRNLNLKDEIQK